MVMNWEALDREVAEMRRGMAGDDDTRPGRRSAADVIRDNQERERRFSETQTAKMEAHFAAVAAAGRTRNAELDALMPPVLASIDASVAEHVQLAATITNRIAEIDARLLEVNGLLTAGVRPGAPLPDLGALVREREHLHAERVELARQRERIAEGKRAVAIAARQAVAPAMKQWASAYTATEIEPKARRALKSLERFLADLGVLNQSFAPLAHANGKLQWVGHEAGGFVVNAGPFGPLSPSASLANITAALRGQCGQGVE